MLTLKIVSKHAFLCAEPAEQKDLRRLLLIAVVLEAVPIVRGPTDGGLLRGGPIVLGAAFAAVRVLDLAHVQLRPRVQGSAELLLPDARRNARVDRPVDLLLQSQQREAELVRLVDPALVGKDVLVDQVRNERLEMFLKVPAAEPDLGCKVPCKRVPSAWRAAKPRPKR